MKSLYSKGVAVFLLWAAVGCAADTAPPAFELQVRFVSLQPDVVDVLQLAFTSQDAATGFTAQEPTSYHDLSIGMADLTYDPNAPIRTRVDAGVFTIEIDGDYVRDNINTVAGQPIFSFPIWTDDTAMRGGPRVVGQVMRMGMPIAEGNVFLPGWPLERGEGLGTQIAVQCTNAMLCSP